MRLYHADLRALRAFYGAFLKAYFAQNAESEEIPGRIHDAAIVKFCAAAADKPEYIRLLIPLVRDQKARFALRRMLWR